MPLPPPTHTEHRFELSASEVASEGLESTEESNEISFCIVVLFFWVLLTSVSVDDSAEVS